MKAMKVLVRNPAFSPVELLVVIAVIAILCSLILPGLNSAKNQAKSTVCLTNLRQIQMAGINYTQNNNDALVPNKSRSLDFIQQSVAPSWVLGNAKHDRSTTNIEAGLLYPEIGDAAVYHCPSDRSSGPPPRPLRTRSYALSGWVSATDVEGKGEKYPTVPTPRKITELNSRPLAETFAFIDEHPDGIDDGVFAVNARYMRVEWKDLPADRHNRGCNLSFLDGHADHWRWLAPKTFRHYNQRPANALDKEDLLKFQDHLTESN